MPPEYFSAGMWEIFANEYIIDNEGNRHNGPIEVVRVSEVPNEAGTTDFEIQGWGKTVFVTGKDFESVVKKEE